MESPDAIVVLAGGIKQDASGRWVSTDLTAADDTLGAPGGKLRVLAATVLATAHPAVAVIASGGKGFDVPEDAPENRPPLCEILQSELIATGIPEARIEGECESNTTYQQLQQIELLRQNHGWRNIAIVSNRWHLPRIDAMLGVAFPTLRTCVQLTSAEEVLIETNPVHWKAVIQEAYRNDYMKARIAREENGIAHIKDGTYQFR